MRAIDADAFKEYICNAYEQVKHMYPDGGEWARQITEDFCKDIDDQPTIETELEWIPCSERLPDLDKYVLCTVNDQGEGNEVAMMCLTTSIKTDDYYWTDYACEYSWELYEVLAWMPLPDPWKEEGE